MDDVTTWLKKLHHGDQQAAQAIWEGYFDKLVRLAQRKLQGTPRRVADEEDVALSAMNSFFKGVADHRFPKLDDREDLWKLLVTISARKAFAQRKRHHSKKRGGGQVRGESVFGRTDEAGEGAGIEQFFGTEPTPEFAATMAETCDELLSRLDDDLLKQITLYKLEGFTNEEIAAKLDCAVRTVERKLNRVREKWGESNPDKN